MKQHNAAAGEIENDPVTLEQFDPKSGSFVERAIFNNRAVVILICVLLTVMLGFSLKTLGLMPASRK